MTATPLNPMSDQFDDIHPELSHVLAMVREALVETFGSQKAASLSLGVSQPRLSQMLMGTEPFSLGLLTKDATVLRHVAGALAKHCGYVVRMLDDRERRQARIAELHQELASLLAAEQADLEARVFARVTR